MQNNLIKIQDGTIYRILQERDSEWLVIDCIKRTMPKWIESLAEFESVPESVLWVTTGIYPTDTNTLSTKEKKYMNEHYSLFASVLGVIDDEKTRSYIIREIAELYKVTKQTIRNNLCLYLVYQDITVLLPHKKEKRNLTNDEKNMRWALNKYYYTTKKVCIDEYAETDDEYHARIIVWAYRKLKAEKTDGEIIRVSEIHKLTSEWKENIIRALPYMAKFADQ